MKICVLQPDYTGSPVDYGNYDPPRDLTPWLKNEEVDHLFLRKATSYQQLMKAAKRGYDIYINLCEGYPEWDIPGFDVIWALERLNLPFTGTGMRNFLHSKETMKLVAARCGVRTPAWWVLKKPNDVENVPPWLRYPLFVKPADSGDSLGIDEKSLVANAAEVKDKCLELFGDFNKVLLEEYVSGPEYTVLVASDEDSAEKVLTLTPFEFVFDPGEAFKTYRMKVTEHHKTNNVPVTEPVLSARLREMAAKIFRGFEAESYARIDIRANDQGDLFFLEINCECSIFYPEGSEGSADYILKYDALGHEGFLRHVIADGIARHKRRQKRYEARLAEDGSLACFAVEEIAAGEVIVTDAWASFRHSATGNTANFVTLQAVKQGEELLERSDQNRPASFSRQASEQ